MSNSNELYKLKKLLAEIDFRWEDIFEENDLVMEYISFNKLSDEVISLLEFRNSRNVDQLVIDKINLIVNAIRANNEELISIHHLIMSQNRDAFIYTNFNCDKFLGILSIGLIAR